MAITSEHKTGGAKRYLTFGALLLSLVLAADSALAHGEHGEAAPVLGGMSLMTFAGFQAELLGSPRPLRVGAENRIIIKILRDGSLEPVRNGKVYMGAVPARLVNGPLAAEKNAAVKTDRSAVPLSLAPEMVWAGNYTLALRFEEKGPYLVRVMLAELDGKFFNPPAILDFNVNVSPAAGFTPGFLLVGLTAIIIAAAGIYWAIVRSRSPVEPRAAFNLLDIGWLNRFVRWRGFQPLLQIPMLMLIIVIAYLGFFDIQDGAKNLATKLTWILWWPGIIFTFVLVGRLWCVMCPFGALNEWTANRSKPDRLFPRGLRNLWLATFLFLVLTWADEQIGVIRSPQLTAWLIVIFAFLAVATGMFFQRRSFCHYLCPITGLLGLYSMVSPVEVRTGDRSRCQKNCHQDCYRGNEKGNGCPMFEFPMTVERNTFCNLCFECVKSCPSSNLVLRFRSFGRDLWTSGKRWLDESYLAVALVGVTTIVTAQMLTAWSGLISGLARLIPPPVRTLMKPITYLTLTESATFFLGSLILFPLLTLFAAWVGTRLSRDDEIGIKKTFVHLAYMFLPVGLAMHLAHNVSHLLSEGAGVVPALQRALRRFTPFDGGTPNWQFAWSVSSDAIYWLQVFLILLGFIFSLTVGYRLAAAFFNRQERVGKSFIPFALLALVFTLVNLYLLSQPMGARHEM